MAKQACEEKHKVESRCAFLRVGEAELEQACCASTKSKRCSEAQERAVEPVSEGGTFDITLRLPEPESPRLSAVGDRPVGGSLRIGGLSQAGLGSTSTGGTANAGTTSQGGAVEPTQVGASGEGGAMPLVPTSSGGEGGEGGAAGAGGSGPACTANTDTDANNCGACGHSCLGGQCNVGRCTPVELAKDQLQLQGLVSDGAYVYWVTSSQNQTGKVLKVPFAGGDVTTLATNQPNPGGLVLDKGNLFWSNVYCCSSTIMKVGVNGGTVTPIASGQAGPQGLTLFDGYVYWPNHVVNGSLMSASTSGGTATPVVSNIDRPQSVAVDATHVYWAELEAGVVRKAPRAGGASTPLASAQTNPSLLLVSAQHLYWRVKDNSMVRLALSGGSPEPFQPAEVEIASMTLDSQNIYWAAKEGIKMAPLKGGNVTTLVTAKETGGSANALWVDATSVYWLDYKGGRVVRMAR